MKVPTPFSMATPETSLLIDGHVGNKPYAIHSTTKQLTHSPYLRTGKLSLYVQLLGVALLDFSFYVLTTGNISLMIATQ